MTDTFPNIIVDTREQQPWVFPTHTISVAKLDTGDYSLSGLEEKLCIERKKTVGEFANNIIEKRYNDWVTRMSEYQYKFLLLEFSLSDVYSFPRNSGIPKYLWNKTRISPKFLLKKLTELEVIYGIHVLFCDSSTTAAKFAESLMYKVYSHEQS